MSKMSKYYKCPHCQCRMIGNFGNFTYFCSNCELTVSWLAIMDTKGRVLDGIAKTLRTRNPWPPKWVGWGG